MCPKMTLTIPQSGVQVAFFVRPSECLILLDHCSTSLRWSNLPWIPEKEPKRNVEIEAWTSLQVHQGVQTVVIVHQIHYWQSWPKVFESEEVQHTQETCQRKEFGKIFIATFHAMLQIHRGLSSCGSKRDQPEKLKLLILKLGSKVKIKSEGSVGCASLIG